MLRTVYTKTTEACNLNCKHCFTGGDRPPRTFWDVEGIKDWIVRFAAYIPQTDHVHFELHGGEPFLAPLEEIRDVVKTMRSCGLPNYSVGATTNLTYKLHPELLEFFKNELDGFATSWDPMIRFANKKQEDLWRKNLRTVVEAGVDVVLNISVSKGLVDMSTDDLLYFIRDTGCYKVLFDRITPNGNANENLFLFPTNAEINDWYLRMHESSERLGARKWFQNAGLEDIYSKFENGATSCGTFCRDCEEKNITLNADNSIGGCPNSAPEESFGNMSMSMEELFVAPKRIDVMVSERTRNEHCYTCPVFNYCGSDCHRLAWEGDVCASPRKLMMRLAGVDTEEAVAIQKTKKVFPIFAAQ